MIRHSQRLVRTSRTPGCRGVVGVEMWEEAVTFNKRAEVRGVKNKHGCDDAIGQKCCTDYASESRRRHCGERRLPRRWQRFNQRKRRRRLASRTANSISHLAISTVVRPSSSPSSTAPSQMPCPATAGRCRTGRMWVARLIRHEIGAPPGGPSWRRFQGEYLDYLQALDGRFQRRAA